MSTSNLGGLITAYATVCRTSDLSKASTRANVQRAILPMLRNYRAELLRALSRDGQLISLVREVRKVIVETLRRLRTHQVCAE